MKVPLGAERPRVRQNDIGSFTPDGTNDRTLWKGTPLVGESVVWVDGIGWQRLASGGAVAQGVIARPPDIQVFNGVGGTWTKPGRPSPQKVVIVDFGGAGGAVAPARRCHRCRYQSGGGGGGAYTIVARRPTSARPETVTVGTGGSAANAWRGRAASVETAAWGERSSFGSWLNAFRWRRRQVGAISVAVTGGGGGGGAGGAGRTGSTSGGTVDLTAATNGSAARGRHGHGNRQHFRQRRWGGSAGAGIAATPVASSRRILGPWREVEAARVVRTPRPWRSLLAAPAAVGRPHGRRSGGARGLRTARAPRIGKRWRQRQQAAEAVWRWRWWNPVTASTTGANGGNRGIGGGGGGGVVSA